MTSRNYPILTNNAYRDGWERIFGKKQGDKVRTTTEPRHQERGKRTPDAV